MHRLRACWGVSAIFFLLASMLLQHAVAADVVVFEDGFEDNASTQITFARALADGPAHAPIDKAIVTYVKPLIGNDVAGFFIQATKTGPALFIAIDPAGLSPQPVPGDEVSFTITEMGTSLGLRQATQISSFSRSATLKPITNLSKEVSAATDLVSQIAAYESELITLNGVISGNFASAGTGFESATINTSGITGNSNLKLRLPATLRASEGLENGCSFSLGPTPMWRNASEAQPAAWNSADVEMTSCPAPTVVSAAASTGNSVVVTFSRTIEPSSVQSNGSQFVFDNGLTATHASVSGSQVTVTTTLQTAAVSYTVTAENTITDLLGTGLQAPLSALFHGFIQSAQVLINEVNAAKSGNCDLVELRVVSGGNMNGFQLWERNVSVLQFSNLVVATGDLVVVHFNGGIGSCSLGSTSETTSKVQQPASMFLLNYDNAWDWFSLDGNMASTDNVLTLYDMNGVMQDGVFLSDDATGDAAADTEIQAATVANAGGWQMVGGGIPPNGFVDADFSAHAVLDLDGTGTNETGTTIQRNSNTDSNTKSGWGMAGNSWGALNSGQTP